MSARLISFIAILFVAAGLLAAVVIWLPGVGGLGLTNLNNTFVFGLWIIADLTLIALGSGAFCTTVLYYLLKRRSLCPLVPLSVIVGILCYASAGFILLLEIGQPLRFWFPFRHPNFASMLTEVTFCITLYSIVLILEFFPTLLGHKHLKALPAANSLKQNIIIFLPVLAAFGALLSLLHQGSLGGVYGALFARPFSWRPGLGIWPWTCLLFIVSAMAAGPLFVALIAGIIEKAAKLNVLGGQIFESIARFSSFCLGINLLLRVMDLLLWKYWLLQEKNVALNQMFHGYVFGKWMIAAELGLFTLLPMFILTRPGLKTRRKYFFSAAGLTCLGLIVNRYIANLQTLAAPTLPFENWESYYPNLIEVAPVLMVPGVFFLALRFLLKQGLLFKENCK